MPAEWEPHEATWLAWPHEKSDWPGKFEPIPWLYGEIVRHLARVEKVRIITQEESRVRKILNKCGVNLAAVEFFAHPTNRSWTRDYCPLFVSLRHSASSAFLRETKSRKHAQIAITHWKFNAWAKYPNYNHDYAIPKAIATHYRIPRIETNLVLEGGAIDVNGAGKLLATEECLLSKEQERNPGLSRRDLEAAFKKYLGATETIWLGRGIAGDDTHGHVDDITRFVSIDTVVTAIEPDRNDPNHEPLKENLARLRARGDLRVITLPMPEPVYFDGQRLPASYANFYIANGIVLAPTFGDKQDRVALNTLQRVFPGREVIGIPCRDLVLGLGTLHCMTQQQPATPL